MVFEAGKLFNTVRDIPTPLFWQTVANTDRKQPGIRAERSSA